ncbi:Protein of unknown function [Pyronema omphalodes CBS 100304]|uniref:Uncharacterized protein n=1 Tax=Pyronema omphalodes (strain CBS 100304) TaxID=1076935 RepID=U4LMW7_PYROM|nr:Protein of unknown function [Pyronema omphalodes CBS 100304]
MKVLSITTQEIRNHESSHQPYLSAN